MKTEYHSSETSPYGKKNCPESKAIPEEVLKSAFIESFRIITDDHKDVREEFLQRTEEELHSDATLLEIERVKKELAQLDHKMQRLLDMHLDQKIDFGSYQDKKLEITKEQFKATERKRLQGEADVEKNLHKRIDAMRKLLTEAPVLKEFDRIVFESIVEKVIVGGYDEAVMRICQGSDTAIIGGRGVLLYVSMPIVTQDLCVKKAIPLKRDSHFLYFNVSQSEALSLLLFEFFTLFDDLNFKILIELSENLINILGKLLFA